MAGLELFQRLSVEQVARWLELHPFEIIRILVADGSLTSDLKLDSNNVERIRLAGGLETWWEGPPTPQAGETLARALVRTLCAEVIAHGGVEPTYLRADNLFRGLEPQHQATLQRAVNALIKEGVLNCTMSATGKTISVVAARAADVRTFGEGGGGPVDRLWDQD